MQFTFLNVYTLLGGKLTMNQNIQHNNNNNNNNHNDSYNDCGGSIYCKQSAVDIEKPSVHRYEDINEQCCCFNMRKIMRAVTQYYDRYLETSGIRSTQFTLLVALASTTAKTLTEIAENLVMDRTTLTRNLKPLAKMGLINIVSTLDKRSKAYALTDKGIDLLKVCTPLWQSAQNNVINGLGSDNYNEIVMRLEKLLNVLSLYK